MDNIRLNVTVSEQMNNDLAVICTRWGCSKSDLIAIIVGQYLNGFDTKTFIHGFDLLNEQYRAHFLYKQKYKESKPKKSVDKLADEEYLKLQQDLYDEISELDEL